jgi:hypothetical protein
MKPKIERELHKLIQSLPPERAREVRERIRELAFERSGDASPLDLLEFAGCIDADELALMSAAIEDGCERVAGFDE